MKQLIGLAGKFLKKAPAAVNAAKTATTINNKEKSTEKENSDSGANSIIKSLAGLPAHVATGMTDVVGQVTDYLKVAEQEQTKRTEINARRDAALATIQGQRDNISELLRYTFQERASVLQKQFEALDYALANNQPELVSASLKSMVSVIQSSPFKTIQEMQQALGSKDFVVRLE